MGGKSLLLYEKICTFKQKKMKQIDLENLTHSQVIGLLEKNIRRTFTDAEILLIHAKVQEIMKKRDIKIGVAR